MDNRDARTQLQAYQLWVDAGKPDGRDKEFWAKACELAALDDSLKDTGDTLASADVQPPPLSGKLTPDR